jgi:hypothetical protein
MLNIIIQIAVAVLLLWASFRALRAENRFLKWVGGGLSALLGAARELSDQMPWRQIGKMDDEELTAVYEYLIHLPGS